jgi:hypothetical protein
VTLLGPPPDHIDAPVAASLLANLGFLARADLPNRPGPAYLLVALRATPTLRHYDPEVVNYWVTVGDRGRQRILTRDSELPQSAEFSWGTIRIVDRRKVSNEYLTFGGDLRAELVDDTVVGVFTSPVPLLRRGGHSQGWDQGAESAGAFFGRLLLAVDCAPGFEAKLAAASPRSRYAAFINDLVNRYRKSVSWRSGNADLQMLAEAEQRRLRTGFSADWQEGEILLGALPS